MTTPSLFLFDLATSVPFSYYDLIVYEVRHHKPPTPVCVTVRDPEAPLPFMHGFSTASH